MHNTNTQTFFLYARKSTDVEDKQVLSIEAQVTELRSFARNEGLEIVDTFIEKKSAKTPGRTIFGEMMKRLEVGEAQGILAWHPDRLARNSVDGGQVIYHLDSGRLAMLKFPTFWFENTSQGKFMLSIAFGQSKYYVDSLAENTKRGLRQKVRRGEYPALAPIGYINDVRTKTVVQDKKKAPIIREAFELYVKNESRLADVADFLATRGITTKHGNRLHRDRISFILSNPFYVGLFRYGGEIYEGKHEPIIAKPLFDRVQEILKDRGKPQRKAKNEPKAFCGLLTCGSCSMGITAEVQKGHIYYRCTKKRGNCTEPYVREESLDEQLSVLLADVALPAVWAKRLNEMLQEDRENITETAKVGAAVAQKELKVVNDKLTRLLDGYLEQDIERETYLEKKAALLSEKQSLQTKLSNYQSAHLNWLEPFADWINEAQNLAQIATADNLFAKKVVAKEIFGSNLHLRARAVVVPSPEDGSAEPPNQWAALRAAHQKRGVESECLLMVHPAGLEPTIRRPKRRVISISLRMHFVRQVYYRFL